MGEVVKERNIDYVWIVLGKIFLFLIVSFFDIKWIKAFLLFLYTDTLSAFILFLWLIIINTMAFYILKR